MRIELSTQPTIDIRELSKAEVQILYRGLVAVGSCMTRAVTSSHLRDTDSREQQDAANTLAEKFRRSNTWKDTL